jgi:outer membrane protein TolC
MLPVSGNFFAAAAKGCLLTALLFFRSSAAVLARQEPQADPGATRTAIAAGPVALSFEQSLRMALDSNVTALLAVERRAEAASRATKERAGLLPNLSGSTSQASLTRNLVAFGLKPGIFPGFSSFVGPFSNFDARFQLVQSIFSLNAIRKYQAGKAELGVATLEEKLARQQVIAATALAYMDALRSEAAVALAQSNVDLAGRLLTLAQDQHSAGTATGVDVIRAETRLAAEQVRLAQARTSHHEAHLALSHHVGLPLDSTLTLTDPLRFVAEAAPSIEEGVARAWRDRLEIQIAQEQVRQDDYRLRAARAEMFPSLDFLGDYGVSGVQPNEAALPTRGVAVRLNVPIFNGGETLGKIAEASSRSRQSRLRLQDWRTTVEQDARLALLTLATTAEQVQAAGRALALARRELDMARDRFAAGISSNIEVINSQTALASAGDAQIAALEQHTAARINLAAALGQLESFHW